MTSRADRRAATRAALRAAQAREHVYPDGHPERHTPSGHCPCLPQLEVWTVQGETRQRLAHRTLPDRPDQPTQGQP